MLDLIKIKEEFPFLSCIRYKENEYICIIQNTDSKIISFYDYDKIKTKNEKKTFLHYGDIWWWQSNRKLSINIFLPNEMKQFRYCLTSMTNKDVEIIFGPVTSLTNLMKKRIKRTQIQLVKKLD